MAVISQPDDGCGVGRVQTGNGNRKLPGPDEGMTLRIDTNGRSVVVDVRREEVDKDKAPGIASRPLNIQRFGAVDGGGNSLVGPAEIVVGRAAADGEGANIGPAWPFDKWSRPQPGPGLHANHAGQATRATCSRSHQLVLRAVARLALLLPRAAKLTGWRRRQSLIPGCPDK